jgi:PAS domain-containing protein
VDDQLRATEVHVEHIAQRGRRFAIVVIHDKTQEFTVRAALDVVGQAVLVIDSQGRVLAFNKPAQALFAAVQVQTEAAQLLSLAGMPVHWWEPGLSGRRKMHVDIGPRVYQVTCSATPLPGEEERLYIVTFLPVARAAAGDLNAVTGTVQILDASKASTSNSTMVSPR